MSFSSIEWIVILFSLLGLIKLAVIITRRKRWLPVIEEVYGHSTLFSWVFLILAIWIFYILLQELTIVQIMAVMAFTALLMAIAFMHYSREIIKLAKKIVTTEITGWLWIYILIWVAMMIWALWSIFATA